MNNDQAKNSSRSFHLAFQRAFEPRQIGNGQIEMLAVPGIVCAAFAIELGIKAIVLKSGVPIKGHKLDTLFFSLDVTEQRAIKASVGLSDSDFESELEKSGNAFVQWRYIYEASSAQVNIGFLQNLSAAVQKRL